MPHTKRVFDWFEQNIDLFRKSNPESFLYVGWRYDCKPWWHDWFAKEMGVSRVTVLDIFPKNVADFELQVWNGRYRGEAILGDVRNIKNIVKPREHDVIFWDHGPEHVTLGDLNIVTPYLKEAAGKTLIYCCPWGHWPQGAEDNNENERHVNDVAPEMFEQLGLWTKTFASAGQQQEGELVGVWTRT